MNTFSYILGTPPRIRQLESFGAGKFSGTQIEAKCRHLRRILEKRTPVDGVPRFSVVIPMHKEEWYILATLKSLAEQSHPSVEFILVSNGELKGNRTQRIAEEGGFHVIHDGKGGVARARQTGLLAAHGDIVVTSDADTLHHSRWLQAIAAHWKEGENVGGYGLVHSLSQSFTYQTCTSIQNYFRTLKMNPLPFGMSEANTWYRRDAAIAVGGYDTKLTYSEGTSLTKKLCDLGTINCVSDKRAAVYTSDRRMIAERMWACTQYVVGLAPKIRYQAIR
jgi:glycosyltransferase involved in cell wall biosynthesis